MEWGRYITHFYIYIPLKIQKMGLLALDIWTFMHFICGYFVTSVLLPTYPLASLSISNILHLITELVVENGVTDKGVQIESPINHTTDIIAFVIGSILGVIFGCPFYANPDNMTRRLIVAGIMALITTQEVMRELLPHTWPISPAYHGSMVFGYDVL
jgi:hypothetical protein